MSQLPVVPGVLPMHAHDERNVRPRKTLTPFPRGERGASFGPDFARTASGKSPLCNLISLPSRHFNRDRYQIRWHFRSLTYFLHLQRRNSSPFNDEPSCNDAPRDARVVHPLCVCVCFRSPPHFSKIAPLRFKCFELDGCETCKCLTRFVLRLKPFARRIGARGRGGKGCRAKYDEG